MKIYTEKKKMDMVLKGPRRESSADNLGFMRWISLWKWYINCVIPLQDV